MNCAILVTCFNRVNVTINSLHTLFRGISSIKDIEFDIYLVDDNSPDNTYEIVRNTFPEINVIKGTGDLYWGGGMNLAWQHASRKKEYDYYLWFNDDGELYDNALISLFENSTKDNIVVGVFHGTDNKNITYGGKIDEFGSFVSLNQYPQCNNIKYMNGNLVLISARAFGKLGFIDKHFRHGIGDYDYSLRAVREGIQVVLSKDYVGCCDRHDATLYKCFNKTISLRERLSSLYLPNGPAPFARFIYLYRHQNILKALYVFFVVHYKTVFPK